ncbi:hypothetical protein PHISP_06830, partial [Aspergillus sp. HF37]
NGTGNGLLGTCRALQNLLNGSPAPSPRRAKPSRLQSPAHIQTPPPSASTRSRKKSTAAAARRSPQRPRGANKRRRSVSDDGMDMDIDTHTDAGAGGGSSRGPGRGRSRGRFTTPKRQRHLPYDLPLGLSQSDFYSLHSPPISHSPPRFDLRPQPLDPDAALPSIEEEPSPTPADGGARWTLEDDRRLVELVLDSLGPSRRDWEACARRLGRDGAAVGRRWRDLVAGGCVGLRGEGS